MTTSGREPDLQTKLICILEGKFDLKTEEDTNHKKIRS